MCCSARSAFEHGLSGLSVRFLDASLRALWRRGVRLNGGGAMHGWTKPFEGFGKGCLVSCWMLTLGACAMPVVGGQRGAAGPDSMVSEITLQRDCFGCATGSMLVLRRDGTATHTVTGKARHGTVDKTATGTVLAKDFDTLARLAVARGFLQLDDQYEDPQVQDGAWTTTSLTQGGNTKQVFSRDGAAPAALKAVEAAIEGLKARIRFAP